MKTFTRLRTPVSHFQFKPLYIAMCFATGSLVFGPGTLYAAQGSPPAEPPEQVVEDEEVEEAAAPAIERIQVIGSNIRGARAAGMLPVTMLDEEEIRATGAATGDELLRSIPQIGDVSFNNERTIGGVNDARGDVASINLRGIGTGNTLTLLNGRRLVLHPGTQTENFVPVTTVNSNTLPVRGLSRLEVLRDGAAAIYGSDAVAGVVNYVLKEDVEGTDVSVNYGFTDGTSFDQLTLTALHGTTFNDNRTYLSLSAAYYTRTGMMASERDYAGNSDRRFHPDIPAGFEGNLSLDNRLIASPWGHFIGDDIGTVHIQPIDSSECAFAVDDQVCAASGTADRDWYYDPGIADQSMTDDVDRFNVFAYLTHDITPNLQFFAEGLWYQAEATRLREQNANLAAQRFTIAADAAYNPFGEDVLLRNYRAVDAGGRRVVVEDDSYRALAGLRGLWGMWDWESAVLYSRANTLDMDYNRIRTDAFQNAINQTDPALAYNPFLGGDPASPNSGTLRTNPQSVIDTFTVDVFRESTSELGLWDFKLSNPALLDWYAGDIGVAVGVEYRYEGYADERDPLLSGEIPQIDQVTGEWLSDSAVMGSSSTPSASGSRNVMSAYAELAVPLHETVDMQLAARFEDFSDVGSVLKPKVALAWAPTDWVQFRGAYTEGFRAPNLPQVVEQGVTRSNTRYDPLLDMRYGIAEVRGGNVELEPETSENLSYGIALTPIDNLLITLDWWNIEQVGTIGILNSQTHLLYDALLRADGEVNEAIVRNAEGEVLFVENQYGNLNPRTIEGMDISLSYMLPTEVGNFRFNLNAAQLTKFEQEPDPISALVIAEQAAGNPALPQDIAVLGAGDLRFSNGNPEWRGFASLGWQHDAWSTQLRANYISSFENTSVTNDQGVAMPIPSVVTYDAFADYQLTTNNWFDNSRIRLGVRNLTDKAPPIASASFGYISDVHSNRGRYIYIDYSMSF